MHCKTLINIIGKYNHYNILAAINLKPETIVFLYLEEDRENYEKARICIQGKLEGIKIREHILGDCSYEVLLTLLNQYDDTGAFLNLSGGSKLMGLFALQAAQGKNLVPIYIDNENGRILKLNDKVEVLQLIETELTVEDIVCSTGAEILKHSTELYDRSENRKLVDFILEHYDTWQLVKEILRSSHFIRQFEFQPLLIEIASSSLSYIQLKALEQFLKELEAQKLIINYNFYYDYIEFTFSSREAKSFIMTAGSWLEALTYRCIREIKGVDDAVSGMLFVWDEEVSVHNELDVVAAVDSHLICISCKDTCKYDVEALNELEVYAEHLGGRRVTRILVSTQPPDRGEMIFQRADEMGIYIIIFDGNVAGFKQKLQKLLI